MPLEAANQLQAPGSERFHLSAEALNGTANQKATKKKEQDGSRSQTFDRYNLNMCMFDSLWGQRTAGSRRCNKSNK